MCLQVGGSPLTYIYLAYPDTINVLSDIGAVKCHRRQRQDYTVTEEHLPVDSSDSNHQSLEPIQ